jgi:outer membrane protein insertion porin family
MNAMDRVPFRSLIAAVFLLLAAGVGRAEPTDGPVVAEVIPVGNRLTPNQQIIGQLKTRPGLSFSAAAAQEDAQTLRSAGFSDVRVRTQTTADGRLIVYFDLAEMPNKIGEVIYKGAKHLKQTELESLSGLRRGMPLNPVASKLACQSIERKYQEDGRMFARVTLDEGEHAGDTRVVFNITEGPEVKVTATEFVGHGRWVSSARLREQIITSRSHLGIGGTFDPNKLEADVMQLREYYKNLGFLDSDVSAELIWSRDHTGVKIIYHIKEGERYKVTNVELTGNKAYSSGELMKMVNTKPGAIYDQKVIQADGNAIQDLYGISGRRVAVRDNYTQTGPGAVAVQYQVMEQEPVRIHRIVVDGNERTRENIILRVLGLNEGQVLSWPQIRAAEERLANLGLFDVNRETGTRPTITVVDTDNPGYKDVIVQVKETTTGSFMLGVSVNSDAGLAGTIALNERNFDIFRFPRSLDDLLSGNAFRGGGQEFRVEAVPGTQLQRYVASWREPSLFDTPYGLALSGYYFTRSYTEYNESRIGFRTSVSRQLNRFWNFSETFRLEGVDVFQVSPFATPAITNNAGRSTLVGFRTGLVRDSRDSYLRPTQGSVLDLSFEQVLGTYTYPLASAEFSKFWTAWSRRDGSGKHVLSFRTQAQWAGDDTPVYERLYGGGYHSLDRLKMDSTWAGSLPGSIPSSIKFPCWPTTSSFWWDSWIAARSSASSPSTTTESPPASACASSRPLPGLSPSLWILAFRSFAIRMTSSSWLLSTWASAADPMRRRVAKFALVVAQIDTIAA